MKGLQVAEKDTIDGAQVGADVQESRGDRLRLPLATVMDCRREAARVYRLARAGRMPIDNASRLSFMLTSLARMIEGADLAARIEALESKR